MSAAPEMIADRMVGALTVMGDAAGELVGVLAPGLKDKSAPEKVERVARAINPEYFDGSLAETIPAAVLCALRNQTRDQARAAIEAMRVPTEAMNTAGFVAWGQTGTRSDCSQGRDIFVAMVDAALAE